MATVKGWALVAALLLAGCGEVAPPQSSPYGATFTHSPEVVATPTPPKPQVAPRDVRLNLSIAYHYSTTDLGDQQDNFDVDVTSSIPMDFEAYITVVGSQRRSAPGCALSCTIKGGHFHGGAFCKTRCVGGFRLEVKVCSYTDPNVLSMDDCTLGTGKQNAAYLDWVGKLGANLAGNPQAARDPSHPNIVNLEAQGYFPR